ncbi:MAG: hypothetical protein IKE08_04070 [Clostridia bacterium]|nr:hypothetical protein [Clostridia bacterium]
MMRELISSLTFMYGQICRGKGIVSETTLRNITVGAHSLTDATEQIAAREDMTKNDRAYMQEARKIDDQIEEMYAFLNTLEIV